MPLQRSPSLRCFFAWWKDLTKMIQDQTGEDFGLRARLDAAKKERRSEG
jgi:hypothetical protein